MKADYDFRKGTRGKFYRPDARLDIPVYLTPEVLTYLSAKAAKKGVTVSDLVNDLLKREIETFESLR
jgi:hypothetical protein